MHQIWRRLGNPPNDCGNATLEGWPYHSVVEVDGTRLVVASDDPGFIDSLAPWSIDAGDAPLLVDFALQVDPPRSDLRPRGLHYLPRVRHGSCDLFRVREVDTLTTAVRRILNAFSVPLGPTQLRLELVPLLRDGVALLVPPSHVGAISHRWYLDAGIEPVYTVSSVVDLESWTVRVDPPLGGPGEATDDVAARWYPVLDWWIPSMDTSVELTPGHGVAQVMRLVIGVDESNAASVLQRVRDAVEARLPGLAPVPPDYVVEQLGPQVATKLRRELFDAIADRFTAG